MVLAANKICKGNRYTCQDKDPICAKMTAINLAFHKINGVVYCMDAILIDKPRATYIINHELYKHKLISTKLFLAKNRCAGIDSVFFSQKNIDTKSLYKYDMLQKLIQMLTQMLTQIICKTSTN